MDAIFEKFSLYDFFNVIFSGGIFLLGLHVIGIFPLSYVENGMGLPNCDIIMYAVMFGAGGNRHKVPGENNQFEPN